MPELFLPAFCCVFLLVRLLCSSGFVRVKANCPSILRFLLVFVLLSSSFWAHFEFEAVPACVLFFVCFDSDLILGFAHMLKARLLLNCPCPHFVFVLFVRFCVFPCLHVYFSLMFSVWLSLGIIIVIQPIKGRQAPFHAHCEVVFDSYCGLQHIPGVGLTASPAQGQPGVSVPRECLCRRGLSLERKRSPGEWEKGSPKFEATPQVGSLPQRSL